MYVEFHYGLEEHFGIPNYPLVCAQKAIDLAKKKGVTGRALDIGCATGRFSIEMAKYFTEVGGIDLSVALIKAAN